LINTAAIFLKAAVWYMELNVTRTISQLISAIAYAMDMNGGEKLYHAWRVSIIGSELAKLESPNERKEVFYGCLLHDIGGIGLSEHIVNYLIKEENPKEPGVLTHPLIGAEIIVQIPGLETVANFILNHHERYNGRGYPLGKSQDEIPLGAQVVGIADFIDILVRKMIVPSREIALTGLNKLHDGQFSSSLVDGAANVLENHRLFEEITDEKGIAQLFKKAREETGDMPIPLGVDAIGIACEVFSQLIDARHPYTIGHAKRVSRAGLLTALSMGLPHDELTKIKWAGLLHDVGKLCTPKKLLDKPGPLTPDEYEVIKRHIVYTKEILEIITDFKDITLIAASDHERYDGKGYPQGLKGNEIPLGARIIAIADSFDAMTSDRSYRKAIDVDEACDEIRKNSGTQFDPLVLKAELPILRSLNLARNTILRASDSG
jgi:HD-GYP domain-containing protein (c-di-GMP phosphodiesterase class II)